MGTRGVMPSPGLVVTVTGLIVTSKVSFSSNGVVEKQKDEFHTTLLVTVQ